MLILGLSGGLDPVYARRYDFPFDFAHDAAAVLLEDGKVIAGIEEERLNRIKHTNKSAAQAARFCMASYGVGPQDIDIFAYYATEEYCDGILRMRYLNDLGFNELLDARTVVGRIISEEFDCDIEPDKLFFVHHHMAHAASAFFHSGYDESLVFTADGYGEDVSGTVYSGRGSNLRLLKSFPVSHSLGHLYVEVIKFLGYELFDEYKVMGLAPYGDPQTYRRAFQNFYQLLPEGQYNIARNRVRGLYYVLNPRKKGEPFTQTHRDIAAALQEMLETIVLHVLTHFRKETGHKKLCMAGGVAHNCSMNGKLLYSGLFDDLFVHPAAHDAGCALGAALYAHHTSRPAVKPQPLKHLYWGTDVGSADSIQQTLALWKPMIRFEEMDHPCAQVARLLAEDKVIGWVQGRSEFGPRALGNRSILADPRPAENKDRINEMVKKREAYRPFAPSVLEESVDAFFDLPHGKTCFPFMIFVVKVREEKQKILGAVTHVDGTARIQTISKDTNKIYWELINEFGKITGIPILLNTSFNNNNEPIVDSLQDALACYLTTKLDYLVAGNYLVSRRDVSYKNYLEMAVSFPTSVALRQEDRFVTMHKSQHFHEIYFNYRHGKSAQVSPQVYELLRQAASNKTLGELCQSLTLLSEQEKSMVEEIMALWSQRFVRLTPMG